MLHLLFHLNNTVATFAVTWPDVSDLAGSKEIPLKVKECAALIMETNNERFPIPIKDRLGLFSYTKPGTMADVETWLADIGMIERKEHPRDRLRRLVEHAVPGQETRIPSDVLTWIRDQIQSVQGDGT